MKVLQSQLPEDVEPHINRYDELTATDVETWRTLCRQHQDYDSALLTPEFACVIASVRTDVRIVTLRQDGLLKAILPIHLRPDGLARPLGTPFADYSGPILAHDFDIPVAAILQGAGLAAFSSPAVPDPWSRAHTREPADVNRKLLSHVIRQPANESTDILEIQRQAHAKRFKNFRRLRNQLERESGSLHFDWGRPDPSRLEALFDFKQRQFRDSGLVDLTSARQSRELLDAVAASPYAFMTAIQTKNGLVSGHFGVRVDASFHPWIAAFNPAFSHFSPGNLLLLYVLEHMRDMGLGTYDLADGHDHYKKYFANDLREAWPIFETAPGLSGLRHRIDRSLWQLAGADAEHSVAGRLKRRMDQIAVSEFGALSRISQFAYALRARSMHQNSH